MFFLRRPSRNTIDKFLRDSRYLPLSYSPPGLSRTHQRDYDIDEVGVPIGHGRADFERACSALSAWKHVELGWVEMFPPDAPLIPGTQVALLIRHLGFWSLNGCRVIFRVESPGDRGFGFAYGTVTNHAEAGEEWFEVAIDPDSHVVTYHIRAVSKPREPLSRVGYPVARWLQARFRRESVEIMRRLAKAPGAQP